MLEAPVPSGADVGKLVTGKSLIFVRKEVCEPLNRSILIITYKAKIAADSAAVLPSISPKDSRSLWQFHPRIPLADLLLTMDYLLVLLTKRLESTSTGYGTT